MTSAKLDIEVKEFKHRTLGERSAAVLREKIITGVFPPGMRLTEEGLAKAMGGISRTCVKEAYIILESEGLVTRHINNKYTEVVDLKKQDIEEIFSLRCALEILAVETCREKNTLPVDEIKAQAAKISKIAASDVDPMDYAREDFALHGILIDASGHKQVLTAWKRLASLTMLIIYNVVNDETGQFRLKAAKSHLELVEALQHNDFEKTKQVIKSHIMDNLPCLAHKFTEAALQ